MGARIITMASWGVSEIQGNFSVAPDGRTKSLSQKTWFKAPRKKHPDRSHLYIWSVLKQCGSRQRSERLVLRRGRRSRKGLSLHPGGREAKQRAQATTPRSSLFFPLQGPFCIVHRCTPSALQMPGHSHRPVTGETLLTHVTN